MNFGGIYIAVYALIAMFIFLGGFGIFSNFFITVAFFAFIVTAVIMVFCKQEEKIKELEKRIEMLEKKINMQQTNLDSFENI